MKLSKVMAEFVIEGSNIDVEVINDMLNIKPDVAYNKNEYHTPISKKYGRWLINTLYEESYDINNQLSKVIKLLSKKVEQLNEIKRKFRNTNYTFCVVVEIYDDKETPAIYLNLKTVNFLNKIGAYFTVDIYVYNDSKSFGKNKIEE